MKKTLGRCHVHKPEVLGEGFKMHKKLSLNFAACSIKHLYHPILTQSFHL